MRGQRAVYQSRRREEPTQPVRMQDERSLPVQRLHARRPARGRVVRRLGRLEVGLVAERRPRLLLLVPPDVSLALGPRLAVGVRGGAVVEDAAVAGPRPTPVRGDPVLLGVRALAGRLVDAVLVHAGVDPGAACGRPVVAELLVLL